MPRRFAVFRGSSVVAPTNATLKRVSIFPWLIQRTVFAFDLAIALQKRIGGGRAAARTMAQAKRRA